LEITNPSPFVGQYVGNASLNMHWAWLDPLNKVLLAQQATPVRRSRFNYRIGQVDSFLTLI
jgi:hypothetical protein